MGINNEFKQVFDVIKNDLNKNTRQDYYENALKDLTQTQRSLLIKILKGENGPNSQDAEEIITQLKAFEKKNGNVGDKKTYISVRNPPRERSWYKSIVRFFSNMGGRISSSKVLGAITEANLETIKIINIKDNKIMGDWLSRFQEDFLAHAVYEKVESVLQGEMLKPAEMILREGVKVEYEQGSCARQRGYSQLPKLSQEDMDQLQQAFFSRENESRLEEILEDPETLNNGKVKYKRFSKLRNEWQNAVPKSFSEPKTLGDDAKMQELEMLYKHVTEGTDAEINLYLEYVTLQRKKNGLRALLMMKNKASVKKTYPGEDFDTKFSARELIISLSQKYKCAQRDILIAFDQAQPEEKQLDFYLRNKFKKRGNQNPLAAQKCLANLRSTVLRLDKLNQEIRMSQNEIYWGYGDVVILMAKDQSKIRESIETEILMNSPIVDDGFYSINLKNTDNLLILGPRRRLEAFKESYGDRIVYIEDLSLAQMDVLKVPDELRKFS